MPRLTQELAMPRLVGKVVRSDLEGGCWTLITDSGVVYQLKGGDDRLLTDGVRVEVDGRVATKQLGLAMVGDVLEVKSYRLLG
jgi:hypothetical protein